MTTAQPVLPTEGPPTAETGPLAGARTEFQTLVGTGRYGPRRVYGLPRLSGGQYSPSGHLPRPRRLYFHPSVGRERLYIDSGWSPAGGRYGWRPLRRRLWLGIGMVIFGAAAGIASLAPNTETLIIFRAIQGLGAAFILPATSLSSRMSFPAKNAPRLLVSGPRSAP